MNMNDTFNRHLQNDQKYLKQSLPPNPGILLQAHFSGYG
jgi:hypothetical protein